MERRNPSQEELVPNLERSISQIAERATQLGVDFNAELEARINSFLQLLAEYSAHTNLVSRSDLEHNLARHVLDSLSIVPSISDRAGSARLIDIGTGGGFPAMILSLATGDLEVTMIESVAKKCRFLEEAIDRLSLSSRARVINGRAEELAHQADLRESFDFATARAVGSASLVCELAVPFLKVGGLLLMQKSLKQLDEEIPQCQRLLVDLKSEIEKIAPLAVAGDADGRAIALVRKKGGTADKFPRSWSKIKR